MAKLMISIFFLLFLFVFLGSVSQSSGILMKSRNSQSIKIKNIKEPANRHLLLNTGSGSGSTTSGGGDDGGETDCEDIYGCNPIYNEDTVCPKYCNGCFEDKKLDTTYCISAPVLEPLEDCQKFTDCVPHEENDGVCPDHCPECLDDGYGTFCAETTLFGEPIDIQ